MTLPLRTLSYSWPVLWILTLVALGCFNPKGDPPAELLGTWTTAAPAYSGSYFVIKEHMIVFGIDALRMKSHHLDYVETKPPMPDGVERFVLHYRMRDGDSLSLELQYQTADPSTLRFGRHKEIWTRSDQGEKS